MYSFFEHQWRSNRLRAGVVDLKNRCAHYASSAAAPAAWPPSGRQRQGRGCCHGRVHTHTHTRPIITSGRRPITTPTKPIQFVRQQEAHTHSHANAAHTTMTDKRTSSSTESRRRSKPICRTCCRTNFSLIFFFQDTLDRTKLKATVAP